MKISPYGPLLIRIAIGSCFILHGSQKVLGMFGGPGLHGFSQKLSILGVPIALSYAAAWFEFVGGFMILLGLVTELGALMCACVMLGAIILVHTPDKGYFAQQGGFEYPLNLLLSCLAIICTGPGTYALFDPFKKVFK
jgi:putative oxidoreductase